ncbi:hypothetical protein D3C73_910140 [compost metagenome]
MADLPNNVPDGVNQLELFIELQFYITRFQFFPERPGFPGTVFTLLHHTIHEAAVVIVRMTHGITVFVHVRVGVTIQFLLEEHVTNERVSHDVPLHHLWSVLHLRDGGQGTDDVCVPHGLDTPHSRTSSSHCVLTKVLVPLRCSGLHESPTSSSQVLGKHRSLILQELERFGCSWCVRQLVKS